MGSEKEKARCCKKRRMKLTEKADSLREKDKDGLKWRKGREREKRRETVCAIKDFKSKYYANTSLAGNGVSLLKHERLAKESRKREMYRARFFADELYAIFEYLSASWYC